MFAFSNLKMKIKGIYYLGILVIAGLFLQGVYNSEDSDNSSNINIEEQNLIWFNHLTDSCGISQSAINFALEGYLKLKKDNLIKTDSILTIIDFSRPSIDKRLFILDLKNRKVIKNTLVAHGRNSGLFSAKKFSNKQYSNMSSLGLYLTKDTYKGKHGYSLRIEGMNIGLNDNAYKRAIVIHGAKYVSKAFIKKYGRIGRSFGCPALSYNESKEIIDIIKDGSCLYIYHPSLKAKSQLALKKLP